MFKIFKSSFESVARTMRDMSKDLEEQAKDFEKQAKEMDDIEKELSTDEAGEGEEVKIVKETKPDGSITITKTIRRSSIKKSGK